MGRIRIERVQIRLSGLVTPPGLRLDLLEIDGTGVAPGSKRVEADGPLPFRAHLTAEDLTAFLAEKKPGGLENPRVSFEEGRMVIDATKRILLRVPLHVECDLLVRDGRYLDLRLIEARAFGAGVRNMAERIVEGSNPVFDVADLPVPARLTGVEVGEELVLCGEAIPPFEFGGTASSLPVPS